MALDDFPASKWSARIENDAQEQSIAMMVTNRAYQTEVSGARSLKLNKIGDITVGDYVKDTDMNVQVLDDAQTSLDLDQQKYFNVSVDDIDTEQSGGADILAAVSDKAGKALALTADAFVFGSNTYANADIPAGNKFGSIGAPLVVTVTNVEDVLSDMDVALRENHVTERSVCVIPPWFMALVRKAKITVVTDNLVQYGNRTVAQYGNLDLVETTELPAVGAGSNEYNIMAFSSRAIPSGVSISKMKATELEKQFGVSVAGLYVFGSEVHHPKELTVSVVQKG